jgi:hypothetical protein
MNTKSFDEINKEMFNTLDIISQKTNELILESKIIGNKLDNQNEKLEEIHVDCGILDKKVRQVNRNIKNIINQDLANGITYGGVIGCIGVGSIGLVVGSVPIVASGVASAGLLIGCNYLIKKIF